MHELPITQSILDIALQYGEQARAKRITDLYLVIGQLSSVLDESVQFYWDIIAKGSIAEGARLHFERIPAALECLDCGEKYAITKGTLTSCPQCDSISVNITAGNEFRLDSIEIED